MAKDEEKTTQEIKEEINELVSKVVGKVNSIDSQKEMNETTLSILNSIVAGVDLSKIEKAGLMTYLLQNRTKS